MTYFEVNTVRDKCSSFRYYDYSIVNDEIGSENLQIIGFLWLSYPLTFYGLVDGY
jgi:hypothetical protein